LANVYGPTARQPSQERVVINSMIARALAGESLKLFSNRDCVRDYIFLADVAQAFLLAGMHAGSNAGMAEMFVIGSGERRTIAETWQLIADRVYQFSKKNIEIELDLSTDVGKFEMRNFVADTTLFQTLTGWKPRTEMPQGIDLTIQALIATRSQSKPEQRS